MRRSFIAPLVLSLAWSVAAQAQTPAPQAAPSPSAAPAPQPVPAPTPTRKKVFSNWLLICATPPGAAADICEADATLQPDGGLPPVAKVAFVRDPKAQAVRLVAIVQANLKLEPGVEIAIDPKQKGVILGFRSCLNSACLADTVLTEDQLQSFRAESQDEGRLSVNNAAGEVLTLKIPRHGLYEALAALMAAPGQ